MILPKELGDDSGRGEDTVLLGEDEIATFYIILLEDEE